ncbi:MAG: OB-fold nucleic acid binding domain-containing protein, partial [Candidatus Omnitrophica bacterium]|nr:OB-fold nucleic acid binding domain-containing protein [Candidatus Omnitrophota bacterium]
MEERSELTEQRYLNLEKLKNLGVNPFSESFKDVETVEAVKKDFKEARNCRLAGRIMAQRLMGKSIFMDLKDSTGKIQLYFKKDNVGEDAFNILKIMDIGDIVGVAGQLFKTRTGEDTLQVTEFKIVSKSLLALPEKWHGLKDVETRFRQRYVDLIVNDSARDKFKSRIKLIQCIREELV